MWQYLKVSRELSEEELNDLGAQGWELVCVFGNWTHYFKKPI